MIRTLILAVAVSFAGPASAEVMHYWTQLVDADAQSFRVIVDDGACPTITVDGVSRPMSVRAAPNDDFPNTVCESVAGPGVTSATLGELNFPLAPADPKKIVLVGDTGCRLKTGDPIQACADPVAWPFATVAQSVAATEADLAIHLGDYHYREMDCPDPSVCGSASGYNWPSWEADFFAPGQVMLSAHAFIFIRGNHEDCARAWVGYLRYLAPGPMRSPLMCDNYLSTFRVDFDDLQIAVIDSSTRNRSVYTWDRLRAMRSQFLAILPSIDRPAWVATHAPLWGYGSTKGNATNFGTLETIQREAFGDIIPRLVSAVVAGDLHFAQIVSSAGNPTQITFGNGGVALYTTPTGSVGEVAVGRGVDGIIYGYNDFGFGLVDRSDGGESVTMFDKDGKVVAGCLVAGGADSCRVKPE